MSWQMLQQRKNANISCLIKKCESFLFRLCVQSHADKAGGWRFGRKTGQGVMELPHYRVHGACLVEGVRHFAWIYHNYGM